MSKQNQLKTGAILSYASILINIIAGLMFTPWMIKQIGQSAYGLYTLSNSLITLFLVDFGLSSATSRFVAKYRAERNQEKVENFLGAIYKLYLAITAIIFISLLVVYFFIDKIYVNLTPTELEQFRVIYVISALFAVINFPCITFNGILNAYEKFIPLKLADIIYRISFIVFTTAALLMGRGLYALVAIHAFAGLIVIFFKYIVIKAQIKIFPNFKYKDKSLYKKIFNFSIWVTVSSLAQRSSFNFTPTVLGIVVNDASAAIAIFGVITTVEGYAYLIPGAINGMFMPKISKIYADGDTSQLTPLLNSVGKFQFAVNGLIVTGFAVIGKSFIDLWVGGNYTEAFAGILLVIIPGLFYNSMQIANTTMIVINRVRYKAVIDCIMAVLNISLSFVLSYFYGVIGSCVAIFIAYTVRVLILIFTYDRILPFNIFEFVKKCYIKMSVPIVFTIVLGLFMNMFIRDGGWLHLVVKAVAVSTIYLIFTFMLGLSREERACIINIAKNKLHI